MKVVYKYLIVIVFFYVSSLCSLCIVYFTPRDDVKANLIELIKAERKSIDLAMYMFTDKVLAQALVDAYVRGVQVRVVLDQVSMSERFGKGLFLQKNGVAVFVHRAAQGNPFSMPIMHNKFVIFGFNDLYKKPLLWTGSFNCTVSAATLHDENVVIVDDVNAIAEYQNCFKQLVARLGVNKQFFLEEINESSLVKIESDCWQEFDTDQRA